MADSVVMKSHWASDEISQHKQMDLTENTDCISCSVPEVLCVSYS